MTGEEYFALLPEPYRSRALEAYRSGANASALTYGDYRLPDALNNGFRWSATIEGSRFWDVIYDYLDEGFTLPPPVSFPIPWPCNQ